MDYVKLGRSGLRVSRLCLGTMNFGPQTTEEDSLRDHGSRPSSWASTSSTPPTSTAGRRARASPSRSSAGGSPRAAAAARRRSSPPSSTARWATGPTTTACPRCNIRRAVRRVAASGCRPTTSTSTRPTTSTGTPRSRSSGRPWTSCAQQGKILYVGSSNFAGWHIAKAQEAAAAARHSSAWSASRATTTCSPATVELEVLPACQDYGLGVIPWSPLAGGLLGGVLRKIDKGRSARRAHGHGAREAPRQDRAVRGSSATSSARTRRRGAGLAAAPAGGHRADHRPAHAWSSSTARMRALEIKLDEQALARLDEIFPGPGGPAPEAYAW